MTDAEMLVAAGILTEQEVIDMCSKSMESDEEAHMWVVTEFFRRCSDMLKDNKEKELLEELNKMKHEDR